MLYCSVGGYGFVHLLDTYIIYIPGVSKVPVFSAFFKKAFLKEKGKNILVGTFFLVCGVGRKIRCLKDSISQYHSQRSPNISWIAVGWFKVCRVGPSLWQLVLRWEPPCPALQLQSKHVLLGDSWIIFRSDEIWLNTLVKSPWKLL